ncbi:hypothetical protein LJB90_03455 [Eubacteriales bacterium OttesenSCG-928-G02]|nr:hypothetical protein [Eubacteriales bacterium OttesenSCG-928-G02]
MKNQNIKTIKNSKEEQQNVQINNRRCDNRSVSRRNAGSDPHNDTPAARCDTAADYTGTSDTAATRTGSCADCYYTPCTIHTYGTCYAADSE